MEFKTLVSDLSREIAPTASPIRKLFTLGQQLRGIHGQDAVFDFSLGSPGTPPPTELLLELARLTTTTQQTPELAQKLHAYPANIGIRAAIEACARIANKVLPTPVPADAAHNPDQMMLTCGAAGAINVFLKSVCNAGDEVIAFSPYFCEYRFWALNAGAQLVTVPSNPANWQPDVVALKQAITKKTRVVIVTTPNNPTGAIVSQESLDAVAKVLYDASLEHQAPIWLLSDEPYRRIVYHDSRPVGNTFACPSPFVAVVSSYSKDLAIPGERFGFLSFSPKLLAMNGGQQMMKELMDTATTWQRTLGFVNAPVLFQHALISGLVEKFKFDTQWYEDRRDAMCNGLKEAGLELVVPEGAFYAFPKCPEGCKDGDEFSEKLAEKLVLAVPARAFGEPMYVRFSFSVPKVETITRAMVIVKQVVADFKAKAVSATNPHSTN